MKIQETNIKRFPRLIERDEGIALSQLLWNEPEFTLRINRHPAATDFVFRVSLNRSQERTIPKALDYFFEFVAHDWKETLEREFRKAKYGDKFVIHL